MVFEWHGDQRKYETFVQTPTIADGYCAQQCTTERQQENHLTHASATPRLIEKIKLNGPQKLEHIINLYLHGNAWQHHTRLRMCILL